MGVFCELFESAPSPVSVRACSLLIEQAGTCCFKENRCLGSTAYILLYHIPTAVFSLELNDALCPSKRRPTLRLGDSFSLDFRCWKQVLAASSIEGDKRLTLSFRSSQYSPMTLLGRDVSSTLPPLKVSFPEIPGTNAGWVDTTFIDEEIRVAR